MKKYLFAGGMSLLLLISFCSRKQLDPVQVELVDGVPHILNPPEPLRGAVVLEVQKIREIDPYVFDEVGIRTMRFTRSVTGDVILSDTNKPEAHRFGPENTYLGNLVRQGEGPGEFQQFHGMRPFFYEDGIMVVSSIKMAWFENNGTFIKERKLREYLDVFIDESRYLTDKVEWTESSRITRLFLIDLKKLSNEQERPILFQADNVGMFYDREKSRGFSDRWATPDIIYTYNPVSRHVIVALNTEYKIHVKDLDARTMHVIERPYSPVPLTTEQKKELISWEPDNEFNRWQLDIYPGTHVTVRKIEILPSGHLAVFHFSGFKTTDVDVFDLNGQYQYRLILPQATAADAMRFYKFGFATVETKEDMPLYVEYRVTNLPDIFPGKEN
jgi:hypothetical protein